MGLELGALFGLGIGLGFGLGFRFGVGFKFGFRLGFGFSNLFDANVGLGVRTAYSCFVAKVSVPLDQLDPSTKRD